MPSIRCNGCGYTNSQDLVGTKAELKYMRVMDATANGPTEKLFFCSDTCYLNRIFLLHANRVCQMGVWQMSMHHALKDPVLGPYIADTTPSEYADIVEEADRSPGLRKYRLSCGVSDPYPDGSTKRTTRVPATKRKFANVAEKENLGGTETPEQQPDIIRYSQATVNDWADEL